MPSVRYTANAVDPSPLGQPLEFAFSGRTAPNRFLKGAMSERLASFASNDTVNRGIPSQENLTLYERWGEGEIGVSLTGNITIAADQLEAPGNYVIPYDAPFEGRRFERFAQMAAGTKKHGSLVVAQVSHPGRQTSSITQPNPISASAVPLSGSPLGIPFAPPREATKKDIKAVIDGFVHAAEYLEKAGYDGIQLHGAHGYLLSQFLSPTTNKRTDEYGGDLKNRMRLILEIREAISRVVRKDFIVGIKINSVEFQEHGFQPEDAKILCQALEENEFDFVELSGGTYENWQMDERRESTQKREAFFTDFAEQIVPSLTKTKSYLTGGFRSVVGMVDALDTVDGIGLGRPLCQEPYLCKHILSGQVYSAVQPQLSQYDFMTTAMAAMVQIREIGSGLQPINLGVGKNVGAFYETVQEYMKEKAGDKTGDLYLAPAVKGYSVPLTAEVL